MDFVLYELRWMFFIFYPLLQGSFYLECVFDLLFQFVFQPYLEVKLIVFIQEAHSKNGGFDTCWGAAQTWYEWESKNHYFQQVPNY